jgi:hypothetical protein
MHDVGLEELYHTLYVKASAEARAVCVPRLCRVPGVFVCDRVCVCVPGVCVCCVCACAPCVSAGCGVCVCVCAVCAVCRVCVIVCTGPGAPVTHICAGIDVQAAGISCKVVLGVDGIAWAADGCACRTPRVPREYPASTPRVPRESPRVPL